jgi:RNA polymerase sigma factor (TIGR02999 family)
MRQLLVESARRRLAQKRGGATASEAISVVFDDTLAPTTWRGDNVLRMDAALQELARLNPRQALMVESRFFGGLGVAETAELLRVSEETVMRDWRAVKAWLGRELSACG